MAACRKIGIAGTTAQEIMLLEHLVYSTAIAIVLGTLYRRYTGRDHAWLVVASAYVPDLDIVADGLLQRIGITVMVHGSPIRHGNFHNAAVMLAYAVFAALLLHPAGVRLVDSFFFAAAGFGAHLFEDALVYKGGYAFFWPLSNQHYGIGAFEYTRDWYGVANAEVLIVGVIALAGALVFWRAWEKRCWK
ncbi:MAG: metal-dependent hydrolase, partial [Methanoculleus sp.]|nr:metal-dependent hydrolase [Methanoculleus sp.]